jgi:hypothetical protein
MVGLALGFAGGYGVGSSQPRFARDESPRSAEPAVSAPAPKAENLPPESTASKTSSEPAADLPVKSVSSEPVPVQEPEPGNPPPAAPPASPVQQPPGRLVVRTTPAGARVILDGHDVGHTPYTAKAVGRGTHTVRLVRDGYTPAERRVVVTAAQPDASLNVQLNPIREQASPPASSATSGRLAGALFVESRPTGAAVYVDGKMSGTTPMLLDGVDAGEHVVRIEAEGYRGWSSNVRVASGERNRVAASLELLER